MDLKAIAKTQKPIPLDTKQNIFKWDLVPDLSMTLKIFENLLQKFLAITWFLHSMLPPKNLQAISNFVAPS